MRVFFCKKCDKMLLYNQKNISNYYCKYCGICNEPINIIRSMYKPQYHKIRRRKKLINKILNGYK